MPKKARELSALEVGRLRREGAHPVGGVPGLCLQIVGAGRSWILRFSFEGRRPELGLGPFPEVGLADARTAAKEARARARLGINPIEAGKAAKSAAFAKRAASRTFAQCSAAFILAKTPEWANAKHAAQWTATLATYADPVIGALYMPDVDTPHILSILEPIWLTKTETATRVRSRIENVLDWSIARGYRTGPNPARWKGHLSMMLAAPGKVAKVEHHAALPYSQLPVFMGQLRAAEGQGARALEFAILCAARSGEVRGATWDEIDLDGRTWTIPGERMKMGREHRVPLTDATVLILNAQPRVDGTDLVFPSARNRPLSDMTLTAVTRRMAVDAVPHGFRATFKTWASERTNFPSDVVEMALAHAIADKVEAAYQRGDIFDKRARLMKAWAEYCTRPTAVGNVTPIEGKKPASQRS